MEILSTEVNRKKVEMLLCMKCLKSEKKKYHTLKLIESSFCAWQRQTSIYISQL